MSADALNVSKPPRKNRVRLIVGIVGLVLLVLVLFHLFGGAKPKAATPPQVVSTAAATRRNAPCGCSPKPGGVEHAVIRFRIATRLTTATASVHTAPQRSAAAPTARPA